MSFSETSGPLRRRRALVLPALLAALLYAFGAASIVQAQNAPTSAKSGQLTGDGLALTWSIGGADFDKPFYAERTWQAGGTVTAKTVTFSGVLRASVPKGLYTEASVSAYVAIPFGPKQEVSWRGELNDKAGSSHELPFSLQIDVPPGKAVMFNASVGKTGGASELLAVMFQTAPSTIASTPTASPTPSPTVTTVPTPSKGGLTEADVIRAIVAIVSALLAVLGALMVLSSSKVDVQDVLNALRDLIRDAAAKDEVSPEDDTEAKQIDALRDDLRKAVVKLKSQGKYIANKSMIEKVLYGVPHAGKELAVWLHPVDPFDEAESANIRRLIGASEPEPLPPDFEPDPNWGQCGEAFVWGEREMAGPVARIFGPDAIFTKIVIQSNGNPFGNHVASEVITPGGQRYVVDMWASMAEGEPKIYTEKQWLDEWNGHYWMLKGLTVERGDERRMEEGMLEAAIREHGVEKGIEVYRAGAKRHPNWAKTVLNSYQKYPWPISISYQKDPPLAVDTPIAQLRGKFK